VELVLAALKIVGCDKDAQVTASLCLTTRRIKKTYGCRDMQKMKSLLNFRHWKKMRDYAAYSFTVWRIHGGESSSARRN